MGPKQKTQPRGQAEPAARLRFSPALGRTWRGYLYTSRPATVSEPRWWASRWADARLPERMTANDYYPHFMSRCAEEGLRVFLLGGRLGVAEKAAAARPDFQARV